MDDTPEFEEMCNNLEGGKYYLRPFTEEKNLLSSYFPITRIYHGQLPGSNPLIKLKLSFSGWFTGAWLGRRFQKFSLSRLLHI